MNNNKTNLAMIGLIIFIVILVVVSIGSCGGSSSSRDPGASYNWGSGYYYDSSSHSVERSLGGILSDVFGG